jgi:hypothetical protein
MLTDAIIQNSPLFSIQKKKKPNDPVNVRINRGKLKYCKHFICDIRYSQTAAVPSLVFDTELRYLETSSSAAVLEPPG